MPETKSKFLTPKFLIPFLGAVVVVGGIAAYLYVKGGPSGDVSGALGSAEFVPSSAVAATYVATDTKVWQKLQQFGTPEAQLLISQKWQEFNQSLSPSGNISYEKDLKPWVGGVMIATLPDSTTKTGTSQSQTLMVVGIKDKLAAGIFSQKLQGKGVKNQEIDYKGEKIVKTIGKDKPTYTTILNDRLVLAFQQQVIEQAIDTYKGKPSFASIAGAKTILTQNLGTNNTLAQIYVPDYSKMTQQLLSSQTQVNTQTVAQLKQIKSMVGSVGVDSAGVRMKAIANLDPKLTQFQYKNTKANVLKQFPTDTVALISGEGINRWWSSIVTQSASYPQLNQTVQLARQQLKNINIDLDKEVFGWMNGEFGIAVIPTNGALAGFGVGGALILETSDRQTAESTFSKLDNFAKTSLPIPLSINKANIGGKDITQWQLAPQQALLTHGWLDQDTAFIAVDGQVATVIATPSQHLLNSDRFQAATSSLPQPNGGYFYLDMEKAVSTINLLNAAPPEYKPILNSIRSIGLTATNSEKTTSEIEMLLALKRKGK